MNPEEIIRLIKEGSYEALEGLGALESLGKNMVAAGQALQAASQDVKKIIEVAGKISKKVSPQKH